MNNQTDIKIDILAFGAHPDDVEAGCGGLLIKSTQQGKKVGIIDLSYGELASNGTVEIRQEEAQEAARIMGAEFRINLGFPNNFFESTRETQSKIIEVIRKYRPETILLPHTHDRHPDHMNVYSIVWPALFTSGLIKFEDGQIPHKPKQVFMYRIWYSFDPSFYVDVSDVFEKKVAAMECHKSQFIKKAGAIETKNNGDDFMGYVRAQHRRDGFEINALYAEPYLSPTPIGINSTDDLLNNYS